MNVCDLSQEFDELERARRKIMHCYSKIELFDQFELLPA